ncbi:hypothetical protein D0860_07026, partial [Hortaea werneckii]
PNVETKEVALISRKQKVSRLTSKVVLLRVKLSKYLIILTNISMLVIDSNEITSTIRAEERKYKLPWTIIAAIIGVTNATTRKTSFDLGVD